MSDATDSSRAERPPPSGGAFVWPPGLPAGSGALGSAKGNGVAAESHQAAARDVEQLSRSTQKSWWSYIEEEWLDVRVPPLRKRLADAGWLPAPIDGFCRRCGADCGEFESRAGSCLSCDGWTKPSWDRLVRLGIYEYPLRGVIRDIKFTAWRRLGHDAGELLAEGIRTAIVRDIDEGRLSVTMLAGGVGVVPIPDSPWRRLTRGIDHTLAIARGVVHAPPLAAEVPWRLVRPLWRESRPSQVEVRASDREQNAARSVHPRRWCRVSEPLPRVWIVVDDVLTTGSTMRAATSALRKYLKQRGLSHSNSLVLAAVLAVAKSPGDDAGRV